MLIGKFKAKGSQSINLLPSALDSGIAEAFVLKPPVSAVGREFRLDAGR